MISLTDGLVRWGLIAAAASFVLGKAYFEGRSHGAAACERRVAAATDEKNAQIRALAAKQATAEVAARAATEAAVRAAVAEFKGNGCRVLTEAERKRLDAIQ